jgi:flavin-dependent dehydrogenase
VVAAVALDLDEYRAAGNTLQAISGFRVSRFGDRSAAITYPEPVSYGIRRCEFDWFLLRRAAATLRLGEAVRDIRRDGEQWVVNEALRARVLIGAGGHFCPVARYIGAQLGEGEPIVAAQEIEFALNDEQARALAVEAEMPEVFFTRDLKGYGWVFRKGRYLNVGLGRQDNNRLAAHVAAFCDALARCGKIPAALPGGMRGHPYLLYDQAPRPLGGDGVMLIGDAAGLAYPKSGEGIRPAVESGMMAADAIIAGGGCADATTAAAYEHGVTARYGPRRASRGFTDILPAWIVGPLAGQLFATSWFARRVVLDGWFFHRDQAPLPAGGPMVSAGQQGTEDHRPAVATGR